MLKVLQYSVGHVPEQSKEQQLGGRKQGFGISPVPRLQRPRS